MPRRPLKPTEKRPPPPPDVKYNSVLVQRFINKVIHCGKKALAMRIVYQAFDAIKEKPLRDKIENLLKETKEKQLKEKLEQILLLHRRKGRSLKENISKLIEDASIKISPEAKQKLQQILSEPTQEPLKIFEQAIENSRPLLEVRPRRVGGATYQVPMEVPKYRGESLAMRWIIQFAREKEGTPMFMRLAEEILQCANKEGPVMKKREELHKMAEANRAFAHFRW